MRVRVRDIHRNRRGGSEAGTKGRGRDGMNGQQTCEQGRLGAVWGMAPEGSHWAAIDSSPLGHRPLSAKLGRGHHLCLVRYSLQSSLPSNNLMPVPGGTPGTRAPTLGIGRQGVNWLCKASQQETED